MWDGVEHIRALLPTMRWEHVAQLGGSGRSQVRRVRGNRESFVVKEFVGSGEGWVRETAALSIMPPEAPTPRR